MTTTSPQYDRAAVERSIREMLVGVGENPDREGLVDTPSRVARAWEEILSGYRHDPSDVLKTSAGRVGFDEVGGYDAMIVVVGVPFTSVCEHHLMLFEGTADVAYLPAPGGPVVGLSKLPRLVHLFARRLQVQERLTRQIAEALDSHLKPRGVGVRVASRHSCCSSRGVKVDAPMVTQALLGTFLEHQVRDEFDQLVRHGRSA